MWLIYICPDIVFECKRQQDCCYLNLCCKMLRFLWWTVSYFEAWYYICYFKNIHLSDFPPWKKKVVYKLFPALFWEQIYIQGKILVMAVATLQSSIFFISLQVKCIKISFPIFLKLMYSQNICSVPEIDLVGLQVSCCYSPTVILLL